MCAGAVHAASLEAGSRTEIRPKVLRRAPSALDRGTSSLPMHCDARLLRSAHTIAAFPWVRLRSSRLTATNRAGPSTPHCALLAH